MKKKKIISVTIGIIIFCLGCLCGVFYFTREAKASDPEGEVSGGEPNASVTYDEHWRAVTAYVATENGYSEIDPSTKVDSDISGKIDSVSIATPGGPVNVPYVSLEPDMVITKWKVHGHIHFE